ncbi:exo 1,3/1,4-beta-D-glucan glucohydrolase [Paucibacter sp. B2R-40]|uniref:glycoside hydrolase family 3 protein n=1 Tax=Paucibacter sp. B2R-40 TaxID=2893554 RepID=UPI0021E359F4|nr:glycoside hydrolase family 3 protein [Paucibacter sp. B2R-40]MCV2356018.1 exo 1,3/1,4-beta-D-glucan glucohydrolase [Paucibacter sp. B2R-40]
MQKLLFGISVKCPHAAAVGLLFLATMSHAAAALTDWPRVQSAFSSDPALEARIQKIVAGMTLAQKIGQMTQPEIKFITPAEAGRYYIGSVLNGGGGWPGNNKQATAADWLALAEAYHAASLATGVATPIPLIWGTDAVHGHGNVQGATLFPHNIGLGAAGDAGLVEEIGAATAKAVRATGIQWVFAPTLAVAQDARWGRIYESFSADPQVVARLGAAAVRGLQANLKDDANVVATAKHFIGDGSTEFGRDQGHSKISRADMINVHGQGYYATQAAGVQTVMASFHSWTDVKAGVDYGKMHGSQQLLTEVLKHKIGFDGFVVSDWNGIGQVPGCSDSSCAQAINAGVDMVMVPEDWRAFIVNTSAQVERGEIPLARIDDAVTRILRVKLRAGLFDKSPAQNAWAGKAEALQARDLARRAVRQSLVLLKNNHASLPLGQGKRILVVGKSADSLANQAGGWSLTWQGTDNQNQEFPAAQSVLAGIREKAAAAELTFSIDGQGVDLRRFDAVIAVIGETPYAEGVGDIAPSSSLRHSNRYPEDLALLQRVCGHGVPVISILIAGRTLYTHDLLNLSDAFVMAWLPGSEGGGVADVLFKDAAGRKPHDFGAKLPFAWPAGACVSANSKPLFKPGYGLSYAKPGRVAALSMADGRAACDASNELLIFRQSGQNAYQLQVASPSNAWPSRGLGADLNAVLEVPSEQPAVRISSVQVNTQQDAKRLIWTGPAKFHIWSAQKANLLAYRDAALMFDLVQERAAEAPVGLTMECGSGCAGTLELNRVLAGFALNKRQTLSIPLACFAAQGVDLSRVDVPFSLAADTPFSAAFANIRIVAGAARGSDALACQQFSSVLKP